jgi:hypothetical protein
MSVDAVEAFIGDAGDAFAQLRILGLHGEPEQPLGDGLEERDIRLRQSPLPIRGAHPMRSRGPRQLNLTWSHGELGSGSQRDP